MTGRSILFFIAASVASALEDSLPAVLALDRAAPVELALALLPDGHVLRREAAVAADVLAAVPSSGAWVARAVLRAWWT